MLVACPSCDARYTLPDEKIGPDGRTLKCAKCKTVWFARLEMSEGDSAPVATTPPDAPRSFQSFMEAPPPKPRIAAPVKKPATRNPQRFATGALAACVILAMLLVLSLRSPFLAIAPKTAVFYAAIGLPPEQPLKNLSFDRMKITIEPSTRGTSALKVEGQLVNVSKAQIDLPLVKVTFQDAQKKPLGEAKLRLKQTVIGPEQMIKFKETLENAPAQTQFAVLTFNS